MKASKISLVIALVAGVLLAGSSAVQAQDGEKKKDAPKGEGRPGGAGGDRGAMMKERLDKMATELKLNEEQKKKVETAFRDQGESMRGLRDLPQEERQAKLKTAGETMDKKMKEILTAEQYTKYEKMPKPGRGGGGEGKGEGKKRKDGEKKKE